MIKSGSVNRHAKQAYIKKVGRGEVDCINSFINSHDSRFASQQGQEIVLFSKLSRTALGRTQPLATELFPGVKRPGRDVHSTPSSTEITNEWSYNPAPLMCLQSVRRNKSTFTL